MKNNTTLDRKIVVLEDILNAWDGQTDPTNKPAYGIALEESDQGFVYTKVYDTQAEYNAAIEEMERQESGRDEN